jgi:hypothetical protein
LPVFRRRPRTTILGHVSGENNGVKCGQNFADFHSVVINRTEGLGAPENVLGERVAAQPLNLLDQSLCALLDISNESIMIGREGPFFGGFIIAPSHSVDGIAQPGSRLFV